MTVCHDVDLCHNYDVMLITNELICICNQPLFPLRTCLYFPVKGRQPGLGAAICCGPMIFSQKLCRLVHQAL